MSMFDLCLELGNRLFVKFSKKQPSLTQVETCIKDATTPLSLIEAAASGNLNEVRAFIKTGADIMTLDTAHGRTPLQWAFMHHHLEVSKCLLDAMSPEQIDFQMKYQPSRFPGLNTFIQTHQINKLRCELSAIFHQENGNICLLAALPFELLRDIFSQNYLTLTSTQISQNINLAYNQVYGTQAPILPESTSKPVIFSTIPSTIMSVENKPLVKIDNGAEIEKNPHAYI